MILEYTTFRDKVMGCWAGKNIGGVLGAPFEARRQVNDVDFYVQDLSKGPPPNDDLDLQIVWLAAVERYGRNVNASILGEYWLSFVIPNWVEYGTGKANLRAGLEPPLTGLIDNTYKDSCGCFIRSEIWACLAPGQPQLAARYAYEDAIVDHAGEGMYGEVFCAAMQSAAFAESDPLRLIEIGLSYLPSNCAVARCVKKAVECYKSKVPFLEARKRIHNEAPGTFGIQSIKLGEIKKEGNEGMEIGAPGFDAPENVGFTIAGLLYGEGDFGQSLCLANSCGEDTDCTCATLGALMGIILGASKLPEKWTKPLDDKIVTMCIDKTSGGIWVPNTATELADRIIRAVPGFLGQKLCNILEPGGMTVKCLEGDELFCKTGDEDYLPFINAVGRSDELPVACLTALSPYMVRRSFPAFSVMIDYCKSVFFNSTEDRTIKVSVINSRTMKQQQWAKITLYAPEGVTILDSSSVLKPLNNLNGSKAETEFTFSAAGFKGAKLELIVDVSLEGRHSSGQIKVVLMRNIDMEKCGNNVPI
ncbi:MAG: ADP-ribosylglycohydrolase family protein [Treponema sp.]|jgi:ADP-ribosylglycohydrolase|nr:ADP-ribosylglycohydrolase family protein [Treponema sp.]